MVCKNCGSTLPEDSTYCMNCNTWQNEDDKKSNENSTNDAQKNAETKHPKYLVENEKIIAKAKWALLPFILSWGIVILAEIFMTMRYELPTSPRLPPASRQKPRCRRGWRARAAPSRRGRRP